MFTIIGRVISSIVEKIAVRTGVPIGGIFLLFFICSVIFNMKGFGFVTPDGSFTIKLFDMAIIAGIHAGVYLLIWFAYRPLFWSDPVLFDALRKAQRELDEE